MDRVEIGKFLKKARIKMHLTQEELSIKIFTCRENISKWERGISIPNTEYLIGLTKVLNISLDELLQAKYIKRIKRDKISYFICLILVFFLCLILVNYYMHIKTSAKVKSSSLNTTLFIKEISELEDFKNLDVKEIKMYYISNGKKKIISDNYFPKDNIYIELITEDQIICLKVYLSKQ